MSHILPRNLLTVYRAQTFDGGPLVDAAGHVRPHGYMPDSQAMGDCLYCGNVAEAACHREPECRPNQHARRNGHPTGGVPQPVVGDDFDPDLFGTCPRCGRRFCLRDGVTIPTHYARSVCPGSGQRADAPAEGTGLLSPEALSLGMLAAGSPYLPDAPAYIPPAIAADWLSDGGRNELDAVRGLLARMAREFPGVNVRVAVSFGVSRLADGTEHIDHYPGWELTAWRGTQRYNGSGQDLERLAGICKAKFTGKAVPT